MRKPRAVIFEDDETVRNLLEEVLEERGYEVRAYREPRQCPIYQTRQERCDKEQPCADMVVTDLRMPRMDGITLLREQRKRGCPLPMRNKALITAVLDREDEEAVRELGCAFFTKPFQLSAFNEWLDECEKHIDLSRKIGNISK